MGQIMKSFLGVFILMFMVTVVAGMLGAYMTVLGAQNINSQIICELEESDFNPDVIRNSFKMAKDNGYDYNLILYKNDGSSQEINESGEIPGITGNINMAKVEIGFNFSLPLLNIGDRHVVSGYAR